MLIFTSLKKLTTNTLISILATGSILTLGLQKRAVASDGVQGIELRYAESAFQCGASDNRQADIKIEVYDKANNSLLTTLSKNDTYTTNNFDSIDDLDFVYKIYNFTHCSGFPEGTTRDVRGSRLLGKNEAVPTVAGFSGQSSVGQIHNSLDSYEKLLLVELGSRDQNSSSYDLQDVVLVVDNNPASLVAAQEANDEAEDELRPVLWGIDEDDGQLFAMEDYTDSSTMIDYGLLQWNDNGTIKDINSDMEAMTIDENGDMYIALDRKLSGSGRGATLLRFNIQNATTSGNNVAEIVGNIGINFNNRKDNVSGLSINPSNGELVAILKNFKSNGDNTTDKLYVIDKDNGSLVREVGDVRGSSERSTLAEDLEHAPDGTLYVTDNQDDHTYEVDSQTGAIIEVTDNNQADGLGTDRVKFEGLGWDFANNRLIGFDDEDESLAKLTLGNGNNKEYYDTTDLGLTDVEGVDFVPTATGDPTALLNVDTDEDGIPDSEEGVGDSDGDGTPNFRDTDSDDDGIEDSIEGSEDSDGDGTENYLDEDSDDDGIEDSIEGSGNFDNETDDIPNYLDEDSDGDTIPDSVEGGEDSELDDDTAPNFLDKDSDGDGIPDKNEQLPDSNDPGEEPDVEPEDLPDGGTPENVDGDPDPNYLDPDSDNDGLPDGNDPDPYVFTFSD